ncbi:unnamed protein product [Dracunculus medinensis]|uniref:Paired domain-containing protein n=1 Tax=Dracunculus medinensis TaxID=318479 RepID=A0A0N4UAY2_DRAME|nr:unnamed protein product [Dracunculus medinensis]
MYFIYMYVYYNFFLVFLFKNYAFSTNKNSVYDKLDNSQKFQGKINQLGGMFVNGRPLPMPIRMRIVDMHAQGIKACDISRKLKVSHGAVSKILAKFVETGSIEPGQIGGNPRSRGTIQHVQLAVRQLYLQRPELLADEIRSLLVERKICSRKNLPTIISPASLVFLDRFILRGIEPQHRRFQSSNNPLSHTILTV